MISASLASIVGLIAAMRSFSTRRSPCRSAVCRSIETIVPFLIRMGDMLIGPFGCCFCQYVSDAVKCLQLGGLCA